MSLIVPDCLDLMRNLQVPDLRPRNVNVSHPQIRRTNSYDVNIHVEQLKHNLVEGLGMLYVVFDSYENARSFGIDYEIVAANLPNPATGSLHLIVRKPAKM